MSKEQLINHGSCCGNGCKNCPYHPRYFKGSKIVNELICPGCMKPEIHKYCPAYGTPFYMSGIPYTDVHTEHCCVIHGCKYGDKDCSVEFGFKPQSYLCESCDFMSENTEAQNVNLWQIIKNKFKELNT